MDTMYLKDPSVLFVSDGSSLKILSYSAYSLVIVNIEEE